MNEQRLRQLEEEQRRPLLTPPPEERPVEPPPAPAPDTGPCVHINSFHIEGVTLLSRRTLEKITAPRENTCLSLSGINGLLQEITNAYVEKGYITSRALLEPQDLSTGVLRIRVVEGRVESIGPDESSTMNSRQFLTIFPFVKGSILNLRDIEQGLDQLNRLPSNRAAMRVEPGSADPYERGHVSGMALGVRTTGPLTFELAYAHPLETPSFVRESEKHDVWYLSVKYTF
ncbi:MAG: hypothetical protein LBB52_08380 [Desulfovibrio sp.]|jgi:hemolysin activation/secretion protein|nr:hypothetical protein [Desulfovibrio sp.]